MKKYTFTIPTTKKTNSSFTNNIFSGYYIDTTSNEDKLKNLLADNIANKYPWLKNPNTTTTTKKITIKTKINFPKYTTFGSFLSINTNFTKLFNDLFGYYSATTDDIDDYDFLIGDTPIRIWDNKIQIGYNFIPKDATNLYYYNLLAKNSDLANTLYKYFFS